MFIKTTKDNKRGITIEHMIRTKEIFICLSSINTKTNFKIKSSLECEIFMHAAI
jgi:hypothetical protein